MTQKRIWRGDHMIPPLSDGLKANFFCPADYLIEFIEHNDPIEEKEFIEKHDAEEEYQVVEHDDLIEEKEFINNDDAEEGYQLVNKDNTLEQKEFIEKANAEKDKGNGTDCTIPSYCEWSV